MKRQKVINDDSIGTSNSVSFGDDLLTEILFRLPPKSLFRFKCVSKAWCNLISDDSSPGRLRLNMSGILYQVHLTDANSHFKVQGHRKARNILDASISFSPFYPNTKVIDCCNGLLLSRYVNLENEIHYVSNPVTKEVDILPNLDYQILFSDYARLAFDALLSPHYKVLSLSEGTCISSMHMKIFSSDTGKWIKSKLEQDRNIRRHQRSVYLKGNLHFQAYPHDVVVINLQEETRRTIKLPGNEQAHELLGECGGSLYYASHDNFHLKIWMLKDYYSNEWIPKYNTPIQALQEQLSTSVLPLPLGKYPSQFRILAFHPNLEVVYLQTGCKLYVYHLPGTLLEEICDTICEKCRCMRENFRTFPFRACLESLRTKASNVRLQKDGGEVTT